MYMNNYQPTVLIVDDEEDIREFLSFNLKRENYNIITAVNGIEAIEATHKHNPDIIILDIMMPEMDGIEVCSELRKDSRFNNTIIILLTARCEDYSQIAGFDAGADDYICKPIKPKILVSRIKAIEKRIDKISKPQEPESTNIFINELIIDKEKYIVIYSGNIYNLPRKEFELLSLLASKPDKVFTREEIYRKIWNGNVIAGNRTIDVHIRKIRTKIKANFIKTIKGVGYKFIN